MKLSKGTIRPGIVLEVFEDGRIKASAPGLFNIVDDLDTLPPIMPWQIGSNCNSFSKPNQYDEVWIMNFLDNPLQLYWFRKDNISKCDNLTEPNELINVPAPLYEENVEILCNREVGGEWATIYFSDGSGWVIGKGESIIQISPKGNILLSTGFPNRCIDINCKNISIGSQNESAHPAAYGDVTVDVLVNLCSLLQQVALSSMANPYTTAIGTTLMQGLPGITNKIPDIMSMNVTID